MLDGKPDGTAVSWEGKISPQVAAIHHFAATHPMMHSRGRGSPFNPRANPHYLTQAPSGERPEYPRQDGFYATYVPRGAYDHLVPDTSPMAIGGALMRGTCSFVLRKARTRIERERDRSTSSPRFSFFFLLPLRPPPPSRPCFVFCASCSWVEFPRCTEGGRGWG